MKDLLPVPKAINILFNERIKTVVAAGRILAKNEECTWDDLFVSSGLKKLGVSTNTLTSVLKELIKAGVVEKVKAPFPWRSKYRLKKKQPFLDLFVKVSDSINDRYDRQSAYSGDFPDGKPNIAELLKVGREAVKEWELISGSVFYYLLIAGIEPVNSKIEPEAIALIGYFLVQYLLLSTVNLHGEAREEAIRILKERLGSKQQDFLNKDILYEKTIISDIRAR